MKLPVIINNKSLTVYINNKPYTVLKTSPTFQDVSKIVSTDLDQSGIENLLKILNPIKELNSSSINSKGFYIDESALRLYKDGMEVHSSVSNRVAEMINLGMDVEPVVLFLNKLQSNPSYRSVKCLYDFLEANNIPLTPEGDFLVFKKVRDDYKDYYTGEFDNSVGNIVKVERNEVDEDPDRTCSRGLHVCAEHYLTHYHGSRGRVVVCKVNPAHVVAVPKDYNNSKMRVSEYTVIGEIPESEAKQYFNSPVMTGTERYINEYEDDSDDYYSDVGTLDFTNDDDEDYDPATNMVMGESGEIDVMGFNVKYTFEGKEEDLVTYTFEYNGACSTYEEESFEVCLESFEQGHVKTTETFLVGISMKIIGGLLKFEETVDIEYKGDSNQSKGLAISIARGSVYKKLQSAGMRLHDLGPLHLTGCEIVDVEVEIV